MKAIVKTIRTMMNTLGFFVLLITGLYLIQYNPIWGFVMLLASFDQAEDVYEAVTRSKLLPTWFRPIDIVFEGILAIVGIAMFIFGLIYWYTFSGYFFFVWVVISALITWSAIEDIADDFTILNYRARGFPASVVGFRSKFFRRIR